MPAASSVAFDAHEVFLLDFRVAADQPLGDAAVLREHDEPGRVDVEPSGGREAAQVSRLNSCGDGSSAQRFSGVISTDRGLVAVLGLAGDVADRLVEEDRHLLALVLRRGRARSRSARRGDTRTPSVSTTLPSTLTQPFSIHSSASRREHKPSSLMRFDRRGSSGFSWRGGRSRPASGPRAASPARLPPRPGAACPGPCVAGIRPAREAKARRLPSRIECLFRPCRPACRGRRRSLGGRPRRRDGAPFRRQRLATPRMLRSRRTRRTGRSANRSRATLAIRSAADGADAVTTVAGAGGLCRWLCNCARFARDDSGFGAADGAGGFVTLRVIRAMGAASVDGGDLRIIAEVRERGPSSRARPSASLQSYGDAQRLRVGLPR